MIRKLSAVVLTALFATMQITMATPIDTGVGTINSAQGGFAGLGNNSTINNVDLNFNGNSHLNWDTLKVGSGQSLNFNAIDGANGLTILNTVNRDMTTVAGQINSNQGIANLIISNPNGVLMQGGRIETAGSLMLTTQDMSKMTLEDLATTDFSKLDTNNAKIIMQNATVRVDGDYTVVATKIGGENSTINAKNVKLITQNGQDYLQFGKDELTTELRAMNINGNLYIASDIGAIEIAEGSVIDGSTNIVTNGNVILNKEAKGNKLVMNGDVDIKGNGAQMFLRNAEVDGNLKMANGGGFLDVGNVHVTKDATIKTVNLSTNKFNCQPVKHFVHVIGDTEVGGNLNIESENNIHIGGYKYSEQQLADGNLTVGGDFTAHAVNGHVKTTIDTTADKISLKSDNLNVITDGKATLTANEYEFSSAGYIGGLEGATNIINVMENYVYIPDTKVSSNINLAGGNITKIETPTVANILSKGDVRVIGAHAGTINITAPGRYMEITGDVHANEINVGKETDRLKLDFENRDFVTNYKNIKDNKIVTIQKDEKITYDLTDGKGGNNDGTQIKGENTYLVGPVKPVDPVDPIDPVDPVNPNPTNLDDNENVKVLHSFENRGLDLNQVQTPIAYAADLDDDQNDTGVRKNVDGSVTVIRAFPMTD